MQCIEPLEHKSSKGQQHWSFMYTHPVSSIEGNLFCISDYPRMEVP